MGTSVRVQSGIIMVGSDRPDASAPNAVVPQIQPVYNSPDAIAQSRRPSTLKYMQRSGSPSRVVSTGRVPGRGQEQPLLIFDGDCGFCSTCARWATRHLPPIVQVMPWQELNLETIGLTHDDVAKAVWWRNADGSLFTGHKAIGIALKSCGAGWPFVGHVCVTAPTSWAARAMYGLISKYRHRLSGGTPACKIP